MEGEEAPQSRVRTEKSRIQDLHLGLFPLLCGAGNSSPALRSQKSGLLFQLGLSGGKAVGWE